MRDHTGAVNGAVLAWREAYVCARLQSSVGLVGQHRCPDAARHRLQHSCEHRLIAFARHGTDMLAAPLLGFDAKRCQQ